MTRDTAHAHAVPNFAPKLYGIILLVAVLVLGGGWLFWRWMESDRARDVQGWQEKLALIAESRTADVDNFIAGHFRELRTLADNPSLKLYVSELQLAGTAPQGDNSPASAAAEPAQKSYLRNLLLFTADRTGFIRENPALASIAADVKPDPNGGLAVIDANNRVVVSTAMSDETHDLMLAQAKAAPVGQEHFIDLGKSKDGTPYIGFVIPVFSIQGEHDAASSIGKIIGIKPVGDNLFGLLKHPGTTEKTLEVLLVRHDGKQLDYLSPLQDGTQSLARQTPQTGADLAEAQLLAHPGDFVSNLKDYRGKTVLATSRPIAGTPWTLIVKLDSSEALAVGNQRRMAAAAFCFLGIGLIALGYITVWWRAHSLRGAKLTKHFRAQALQARAQETLLKLVTNNQPESLYIVDSSHTYHFANQKAADKADMAPEHVIGKTLADMRGGARASAIVEQCDKALRQHHVIYDTTHTEEQGQPRTIRSAYVPLEHIPLATLPEPTPGVLVVEQDISAVIREREQRLTTQRQLVETLVKLVDQRDPFAANHSLLVSKVAYEVAVDMELDDVTIDTTRIAGNLMNIGKIVVPSTILTKKGSLDEDEKRTVRHSMHGAAELIKDISFDGPVADTLTQWQENWDGSGELGLKGNAILISARIIAVANAFIGMISPRSWRKALSIDAATKLLLEQSGAQFDQRVVVALINYVENHQGRLTLQEVGVK